MARRAEAAVVAGVGAAGTLGFGVAAISLFLTKSVASWAVLLQVAAGMKVLVKGSPRQRFELFVAVDDVRVLLLRLRRHIEQLFDVTVANTEREHLNQHQIGLSWEPLSPHFSSLAINEAYSWHWWMRVWITWTPLSRSRLAAGRGSPPFEYPSVIRKTAWTASGLAWSNTLWASIMAPRVKVPDKHSENLTTKEQSNNQTRQRVNVSYCGCGWS